MLWVNDDVRFVCCCTIWLQQVALLFLFIVGLGNPHPIVVFFQEFWAWWNGGVGLKMFFQAQLAMLKPPRYDQNFSNLQHLFFVGNQLKLHKLVRVCLGQPWKHAQDSSNKLWWFVVRADGVFVPRLLYAYIGVILVGALHIFAMPSNPLPPKTPETWQWFSFRIETTPKWYQV